MAKGFYIDVATIFDERAAVVKRLAPDSYVDIIKDGYHKRKGDFFKGVDPVAYRELYEKHEMETMVESVMTNAFQFLQPQIADFMTEYAARQLPIQDSPMLDINIHGYDFSDEEKASLGSLVYLKVGGIIGVRLINVPVAELIPQTCRDQYNIMMMYDYHHFLNAHLPSIRKNPCPTLILIAPMVYFNENPEESEEAKSQLENGLNGLAVLEAFATSLICLRFVNAEVFSIIYPDDRISEINDPSPNMGKDLEDFQTELLKQRAEIARKSQQS